MGVHRLIGVAAICTDLGTPEGREAGVGTRMRAVLLQELLRRALVRERRSSWLVPCQDLLSSVGDHEAAFRARGLLCGVVWHFCWKAPAHVTVAF